MMAINPQIITTAAGELVVITRAEFDQLMACAAEAEEDAADAALYAERKAALARGTDAVLPPEVSGLILSGNSLLKALRKWRGKTQNDVALATGMAQGYLSDLETGRKIGGAETLLALAKYFDIDPNWLIAQ